MVAEAIGHLEVLGLLMQEAILRMLTVMLLHIKDSLG
jgi:hypothetical protein